MICIDRGPEPAALRTRRENALQELRTTIATKGGADKLVRADFPDTYKTVGEDLRQRQHLKCCYCELKIRHQGQDVEHFRPASKYWWLAYTWENLFFACQNCNRWGKNDDFPLQRDVDRLVAEETPPGREAPQLIDPSRENPIHLLRFVLDPQTGSWRLVPRNNSPRAAITVQVLKLNANDLVEMYDDHVNEHLQPEVDEALDALANDQQDRFAASWIRLSVRFTQRTMPFSALAYDVADHFFPESKRAQLNLALPMPQ